MIQSLRNLVVRNFWLKLFSLLVAVLIWLTVSFSIRNEGAQDIGLLFHEPARVLRVPVLVMSTAVDVRECRVKPDHVEVTVWGANRTLDALQPRDIRAVVDLTDIHSASAVRKRIEVTTPPGVTHVSVFPPDVEVYLPAKEADQPLSPLPLPPLLDE